MAATTRATCGIHQCIRAGRRLALKWAQGSSVTYTLAPRALVACLLERKHFRMGFTGLVVEPAADDIAVLHQHAADAGIGVGGVEALLRKSQGLGHDDPRRVMYTSSEPAAADW